MRDLNSIVYLFILILLKLLKNNKILKINI